VIVSSYRPYPIKRLDDITTERMMAGDVVLPLSLEGPETGLLLANRPGADYGLVAYAAPADLILHQLHYRMLDYFRQGMQGRDIDSGYIADYLDMLPLFQRDEAGQSAVLKRLWGDLESAHNFNAEPGKRYQTMDPFSSAVVNGIWDFLTFVQKQAIKATDSDSKTIDGVSIIYVGWSILERVSADLYEQQRDAFETLSSGRSLIEPSKPLEYQEGCILGGEQRINSMLRDIEGNRQFYDRFRRSSSNCVQEFGTVLERLYSFRKMEPAKRLDELNDRARFVVDYHLDPFSNYRKTLRQSTNPFSVPTTIN
jgi:hypothetical protein